MDTISHPMRLDSSGAVVTIDDASPRAAAEMTGHVISCLKGERPLAPAYGVADASSSGVSQSSVAGAMAHCEPEVAATAISLTAVAGDRVRVHVDVEWSQS